MDFETKLEQYARLAVCAGVNLQPGQELLVSAPIDCAVLVRKIVRQAYAVGAKDVTVQWSDEAITRMRYDACPVDRFEHAAEWIQVLQNGHAKRGGAILSITAGNPDALAGVDPQKISAWIKAVHRDCKEFYDGMNLGYNTWSIIGASSPAWAQKVFPGEPEEDAVAKLWDAIFKTVRIGEGDPLEAWQKHRESFQEKMDFLNRKQFVSLHYNSANGTDIHIGMTKKHHWVGGGETTRDGTFFFPNMPTEEIFCTPDNRKAEGRVYSTLPLNFQGNLIDRFYLEFHAGEVVDFGAETGYEALKALLGTDAGAKRLGEVALIPRRSPISEMGILFYNTLFDENASCHFAIGEGFPECIEGGLDMSQEELTAAGVNHSAAHVDFMLGADDLCITGTDESGEETLIFQDGNWAI